MNERFTKGRRIRSEVLGEATVRQRLDEADEFNRPLQELITEYCWGACWGGEALSRRERSLLNLGMLSALNRPEEFALHVRAALRNGLSRDEIREALIQVAVYCGVPAGVEAFRIATRVFAETDAA
ncbi:MAG TPA: carboxymuconolactone decarboxylase family protein [Steroidobacteraceae bacterium]|jgi:4-carboxymuconolactone decarboxylase|nr:carboxymuconolactone decarboxylase family protein [Steroidobacteraceae bacterium]